MWHLGILFSGGLCSDGLMDGFDDPEAFSMLTILSFLISSYRVHGQIQILTLLLP